MNKQGLYDYIEENFNLEYCALGTIRGMIRNVADYCEDYMSDASDDDKADFLYAILEAIGGIERAEIAQAAELDVRD